MKKILPICLCFFLITGCVEPLDLDGIVSGTPQLVVDGLITDQAEPYQVRLTYSATNLLSYQDEEISGAEVYVTDAEGERYEMYETGSGIYQSDPAEFQGVTGRTYQLHIRMPDGKTYASIPERMPASVPIDSIYARHENRPYLSSLGTALDEWGMQFYVSGGSGQKRAGYYQWIYTETYEFAAPLLHPNPLFNAPTCYRTFRATRGVNVASSEALQEDRIIGQPLTFATKRNYKLQRRYSLLVTQYALNERAYNFWNSIRNQAEDGGSVFAPPPSPIPGNLYNVNDDNEQVLGLFQVSGVSQQRFFLRRSEVPNSPGGPPGGFSECVEGALEIPETCYDCSLLPNVSTDRPSYW